MQRSWGALLALTLAITSLIAPVTGPRGPRTVQAVTDGAANTCRRLGLKDNCSVFDARRIASVHVSQYQATWVHRALTLQRQLDDDVPLARSTLPHTHNSFNASTYSPTLTNQDPNQVYSITDQLRMDVRAIEFDVHWVPSPYGTLATGGYAVTLCHGNVVNGIHVGCTNDPPLKDGLRELRAWLDRPENKNEVVLLYLENNLDGSAKAHDIVANTLQQRLGDLVARPPAGQPCAPIPTSITPAALRAAGHRVVIVGNCGPGAWGSWVFERGNASNWVESSSGPGDDYPGLTNCAAERTRTNAGHALVRWYDDSAWLSAMVDGQSSQLTPKEAAAMARCGVNLIGFDQLEPTDPRLAAIVWSWAPHEPSSPEGDARCAASGIDTHFHNEGCGAVHPFACSIGPDRWVVTTASGAWRGGQPVCAAEFPGSSYAVPRNGWENSLLRTAAGANTVWLNYADATGNGDWSA